MPRDATVPKTVAMKLARTETSREFPSSFNSVLSWNRRVYCRRVNPSNWVTSLPVLNDATMSTAMGTYRKMKIRTVRMRLALFIR